MPLHKGSSKDIVGKNIRKEIRQGKSRTQAVAIALNQARKYKRKAKR